jgi:cytochrome-b5 reductase
MKSLLAFTGFCTGVAACNMVGKSSPHQAYSPVTDVKTDFRGEATGRKSKPLSGVFKPFRLGEVINMSEDQALFRFLLPDAEDEFDLPVCSSIQCYFRTGGAAVEQCQRFYTPITPNKTKGYFDLVVRKYPRGRMTEHLWGLEVGEPVLMRVVAFKLKYHPNKWKQVGMIAGGTGFAPMVQVINEVVRNPKDTTQLSMLYLNRNEHSTMLKGLFDDLARRSGGRFKMHYCVDQAEDPANWKHFTGFATLDMLRKTMPPSSKDSMVLICGPDKMLNHIAGLPLGVAYSMSQSYAMQPVGASMNNLGDVGGLLGRMGYTRDNVYKF